MIPHHAQMELSTVLKHGDVNVTVINREDAYKPIGVRLAKLLHQYDGSPSSELWSSIQALSFEILRESK